MANAAFAIQILTAAVGSSVSTLTPTVKIGSAIVENLDSTYSLYFTTDGTTPVAGFGSGAIQLLPYGVKMFNMDEITAIKAICSSGESANLQVVCRPQCGPLKGA